MIARRLLGLTSAELEVTTLIARSTQEKRAVSIMLTARFLSLNQRAPR